MFESNCIKYSIFFFFCQKSNKIFASSRGKKVSHRYRLFPNYFHVNNFIWRNFSLFFVKFLAPTSCIFCIGNVLLFSCIRTDLSCFLVLFQNFAEYYFFLIYSFIYSFIDDRMAKLLLVQKIQRLNLILVSPFNFIWMFCFRKSLFISCWTVYIGENLTFPPYKTPKPIGIN